MLKSEVLKGLKVDWECVGKSSMTSGNEYKVRFSRNGKMATIKFHDNYLNQQNTSDVVYSWLMDSMAYENSSSFEDFCLEFGYSVHDEDYGLNKDSYKVYLCCKRNYEKLHKFFTNEEIKQLENDFQDY